MRVEVGGQRPVVRSDLAPRGRGFVCPSPSIVIVRAGPAETGNLGYIRRSLPGKLADSGHPAPVAEAYKGSLTGAELRP
jgi:hypothetical protein